MWCIDYNHLDEPFGVGVISEKKVVLILPSKEAGRC